MITCAKIPCGSCPYRRDVPSGVWAAVEYDKLPLYDGDMLEQMLKGGQVAFYCHQQDGKLCAGWVGAHGPYNLIALRVIEVSSQPASPLDPSVWAYKPHPCVPLFKTGAEACAHGKREIKRPGPKARRTVIKILSKREAKRCF